MIDDRKKIWIDLDNSPHVIFFILIIEDLQKCGYRVVITTRDCFHVCELANLNKIQNTRIGRHYGRNSFLKMAGMFIRSLQMIPFLIREKPYITLSHGSRSQLLIALIFRIKSVLIDDYEYSKYPLVKPNWLIVPEVIRNIKIMKDDKYILKYPGIKEDVYIHDFTPDDSIESELGFSENDLIVTIRPPATEAHYNNSQSDVLFKATIDYVSQFPDVRMVIIPRNQRQELMIRKRWWSLCENGKIQIPRNVVDGCNLIWFSDLVISGGGTMNREAAALGVPVYSIFRGKIGAIDRYLANTRRLTLIESVDDIHTKIKVTRRDKSNTNNCKETDTKASIVNSIIKIIENRY